MSNTGKHETRKEEHRPRVEHHWIAVRFTQALPLQGVLTGLRDAPLSARRGLMVLFTLCFIVVVLHHFLRDAAVILSEELLQLQRTFLTRLNVLQLSSRDCSNIQMPLSARTHTHSHCLAYFLKYRR